MMNKMSKYYTEDDSYVDVHGRDVKVLICEETGNILVPISEVKKTGFNIYHKSQYNKLHVSESQFHKEFHLYMLEAATTYMLQRQIAFREEVLFESIDKCKKVLTGENSSPQNSNFLKSHVVVKAPDSSLIIKASPEVAQDKRNVRSIVSKSPSQDLFKSHIKQERHEVELNSTNNRGFSATSSPKSVNSNLTFDKNATEERCFQKLTERRDNFSSNIDTSKVTPQLRKPLKNYNFNSDHSKSVQNDNASEKETLPRLPTVQLSKPQHKVLITSIEKPSLIWVQDSENVDDLLDIDRKITDEIDSCPEAPARKVWNKIYLAQYEGLWCRCRVIKFKPSLTVHFIDYGNTAELNALREIPSSLETIPCQAVKVLVENTKVLELYSNITLSIKERPANGLVHAEIVSDDEVNLSNTQPVKLAEPDRSIPVYFKKPEPMCKIQNNLKIMICGTFDGKFAVRTKESFQKLKEIEEAIKNSSTEEIDSPQQGQLVLCKPNNNFQRGVITKIESNLIHVKCLDYYESFQVASELIKNINEPLSCQPITYCLTPRIKGYVDNEDAKKLLEQLAAERIKGTVVLEGSEFDLLLSDGLLSEKLSKFQMDANRTMFRNMKKYQPALGLGEYVVYAFENVNDLTLVSQEDCEANLDIVIKQLGDYKFYDPVVGEVCYGNFEQSWSRAVILEKSDNKYKVKFVDFGNTLTLSKEDLRELTEDAKTVPIMGFSCRLTGLPAVENLNETLKTLFQDSDSYEFNIKKLNGDHYEVEIPSIDELL